MRTILLPILEQEIPTNKANMMLVSESSSVESKENVCSRTPSKRRERIGDSGDITCLIKNFNQSGLMSRHCVVLILYIIVFSCLM